MAAILGPSCTRVRFNSGGGEAWGTLLSVTRHWHCQPTFAVEWFVRVKVFVFYGGCRTIAVRQVAYLNPGDILEMVEE